MSGEFGWLDYLDLARGLNDSNLSRCKVAAKKRGSIGRAYYAIFMTVRENLERELQKDYGGSDVHVTIRKDLDSHLRPGSTDLSSVLAVMCQNRKHADYERKMRSDPAQVAAQQIGLANRALTLIAQVWPPVSER